jgi:hypothetical protein
MEKTSEAIEELIESGDRESILSAIAYCLLDIAESLEVMKDRTY